MSRKRLPVTWEGLTVESNHGAIHTMVQNRPYVFEGERINFEYGPGEPLSKFPNITDAGWGE